MKNLGNPYCRKATQTWFAKIDGVPKQLAPKGANEDEARRQWAVLKLKIDAENGVVQKDEQARRLDTFVGLYLDFIGKEIKPQTLAQKSALLKKFAADHGAQPIDGITPLTIRQWVEKHEGWNATSRQIGYKILNAFWVRLSEYGVKDNPVKGVLHKPQALVRGETCLIPPHELQSVLGASGTPYRAIFEILSATGARPSEILGLTADEVDIERGEIQKQHHKTAHKGGVRLILIPHSVLGTIKSALQRFPSGLLFRTIHGRQITSSYLAEKLQETKRQRGLTSKWTPYSFRHQFCVSQLEKGRNIFDVASWCGNTTATLEKHYAKAVSHARSTRHLLDA